MNVNVSRAAVNRAREIVQTASRELVDNHNSLNSDIESDLAQWKDTNVLKFLQEYSSMSSDLSEILMRLRAVDEFCYRVDLWLREYLGE